MAVDRRVELFENRKSRAKTLVRKIKFLACIVRLQKVGKLWSVRAVHITGRWLWKTVWILSGFGLARTTNMNDLKTYCRVLIKPA